MHSRLWGDFVFPSMAYWKYLDTITTRDAQPSASRRAMLDSREVNGSRSRRSGSATCAQALPLAVVGFSEP
ncbi:hypothetical protein SAMN05216338_1016163 [Bradyrhizobium sp. Rc2d]|nr:hypothetical protein SAMN05216338_1016163 [Bradyrhizobium sp. Rc2d]